MATYISWIFKMHFCNLQPKAFHISKKKKLTLANPTHYLYDMALNLKSAMLEHFVAVSETLSLSNKISKITYLWHFYKDPDLAANQSNLTAVLLI